VGLTLAEKELNEHTQKDFGESRKGKEADQAVDNRCVALHHIVNAD